MTLALLPCFYSRFCLAAVEKNWRLSVSNFVSHQLWRKSDFLQNCKTKSTVLDWTFYCMCIRLCFLLILLCILLSILRAYFCALYCTAIMSFYTEHYTVHPYSYQKPCTFYIIYSTQHQVIQKYSTVLPFNFICGKMMQKRMPAYQNWEELQKLLLWWWGAVLAEMRPCTCSGGLCITSRPARLFIKEMRIFEYKCVSWKKVQNVRIIISIM